MTLILAIDPGNIESAWLLYDTEQQGVVEWAKVSNGALLHHLDGAAARAGNLLAVEMIGYYGAKVGAEVFQTCVWIGRFIERWGGSFRLVYRKQVVIHLCGTAQARDMHVRQALLDRYGPGREVAIGTKKAPGPLYGLSGDGWSALGVAVTAAETG